MTEQIEFVSHSSVLLYKSNALDIDVARAAWVSQSTEAHEKEADPGRVEKLIAFLWRNGHHSPFEHGSFTFVVSTPIFAAREFFRHRSMSYNEVSGRYTTLKPCFYVPESERPMKQEGKVGNYTFTPDTSLAETTRWSLEANAEAAWSQYVNLIGLGVAKEVARMVLPVNTMTTFWVTVNPRNLMHFLDLRTDAQAQHEIREVAEQMEKFFAQQMPLTHQAWSAHRGG